MDGSRRSHGPGTGRGECTERKQNLIEFTGNDTSEAPSKTDPVGNQGVGVILVLSGSVASE